MNQAGRALKSAIRILYWKCRYGRRIRTSVVQGFDRVHVEAGPQAGIILGERIQNRGDLYLVCYNQGRLRIGGHAFFNTGCCVTCMGDIRIGDHCKFGNNLVIVDHDHDYRNRNGEYTIGEVVIGDRVWVGANCTILKGAHIGDDCVIAAGSIVRSDVPAGSLFCQKRRSDITPITRKDDDGHGK